MDGTLWYENGGAGIFHHSEGPFSEDLDPVWAADRARVEGIGAPLGFGQTEAPVVEPVASAAASISRFFPASTDPTTFTSKTPSGTPSNGTIIFGLVAFAVIGGAAWLALRQDPHEQAIRRYRERF